MLVGLSPAVSFKNFSPSAWNCIDKWLALDEYQDRMNINYNNDDKAEDQDDEQVIKVEI